MVTVYKPDIRYKTVTPDEAHALLRRSKRKNVPVKKRKIDQYARDMLSGKWDPFNSQAISIDVDNNIVNGHQRLMACVQAGVPFRTLFIEGVPSDSFKNEDTGRSRDAGHFFAILGEKFYMELAAGARSLFAWEQGNWRQAAMTSGGSNVFVSNEQLQEEVERRPILREAAEFFGKNKNPIRGRFRVGPLIALWALGHGQKAHAEFWKEVLDRLSVDKKSPAYQLNRRIDYIKSRGGNLSALSLHALLTKAWNWYATDNWKELSWDPDKEKYPEPLSDSIPALKPDDTSEVISITLPTKGRRTKAPAGLPKLKVVPAPEKRPKKGRKLRGGLDTAAG